MSELVVTEFRGYYAFLSSFWAESVSFKHPDRDVPLVWDTNEHAFQAAKTSSVVDICRIYEAPTAQMAKSIGRSVELRPGWDGMRKRVMLDLNLAKFGNVTLRDKLVATAPSVLIEGNHWHDNFWGQCYCSRCEKTQGKNYLGRILMAVRDVMQND